MKFKFVGDPNNSGGGADGQTILGHQFFRGHATEVPDSEKEVIERLRRHSHLAVVGGHHAAVDASPSGDDAPESAEPKKRGRKPKAA